MGHVETVLANDGRARREFLEFPYRHYRGNPYWVPPLRIAQKQILDVRKHPFYANAEICCFLALSGGKPSGRIAAILDRNYNRFHDDNLGFFGFFECVEDPDVARSLLFAAREWLSRRGASAMRGPVNPSTNYECGMLVEGFDSSPAVMMPYNHRYYPSLVEACGLTKSKDLFAYYCSTRAAAAAKKVERVAARAAGRNGLAIRPIDMKSFEREVESIWGVYNSAWERNWGFIPMTREEFVLMAKEMKQILVPDLCLVGEVDGRVAGFALALPDINLALKPADGRLFPVGLLKILYYQRFIKDLRVLALGVTEEWRTAGVAACFYTTLIRNGARLGYRGGEFSWVLEDNVLMIRSFEVMGATRYKRYRIYDWN